MSVMILAYSIIALLPMLSLILINDVKMEDREVVIYFYFKMENLGVVAKQSLKVQIVGEQLLVLVRTLFMMIIMIILITMTVHYHHVDCS